MKEKTHSEVCPLNTLGVFLIQSNQELKTNYPESNSCQFDIKKNITLKNNILPLTPTGVWLSHSKMNSLQLQRFL